MVPLCPCWKHAIQITDAGKLPLSPWPEMNPGVQARLSQELDIADPAGRPEVPKLFKPATACLNRLSFG